MGVVLRWSRVHNLNFDTFDNQISMPCWIEQLCRNNNASMHSNRLWSSFFKNINTYCKHRWHFKREYFKMVWVACTCWWRIITILIECNLIISFPFQMVTRTKKIFVGGLSAPSTLDDVKNYFEQFGRVS